MQKLEFKVIGTDCAEEIETPKREVGPLAGGENGLAFDLPLGKMSVDGSTASTREIMDAVAG